ncbi:hypothetical protein D9M71_399140 [compost metagenome]
MSSCSRLRLSHSSRRPGIAPMTCWAVGERVVKPLSVRPSSRSRGADLSASNNVSASMSGLPMISRVSRLGKFARKLTSRRRICNPSSLRLRICGIRAVKAGSASSCIRSSTSVLACAPPSRREALINRSVHCWRSKRSSRVRAVLTQRLRSRLRVRCSTSSRLMALPRSPPRASSACSPLICSLLSSG